MLIQNVAQTLMRDSIRIMSDSDSDLGPVAPPQAAAAKKRRVLDGETALMEQVAARSCSTFNHA